MKIDPIPVEELRFYDWFYSCDHKYWYYYKPRKKADFDPTILDNTLDDNIKKINSFLNDKGFKTMPSCEGHLRSTNFIKTAYKNLLNDAKKIQTTGLWLVNCENNNMYYIYDPLWKLPFSYEEFEKSIGPESKIRGYIGFEINNKKIIQKCIDILNNLGGIECRYNKGVLEIINTASNNKVRKNNWNDIFEILKEVIGT